MDIIVNGDEYQLDVDASLAELISKLDLADQRLAVEVNLHIIPRSDYDTYRLQVGDKVEIVRAIGGG